MKLLGVDEEVEEMKKQPAGLRIAVVGWVFFFVSTFPALAQLPLDDALVNGRRVVIYSQEGVKRDLVDQLAEEIAKGRRFQLVAERDQADLAFVLGAVLPLGDTGGTIAPPIESSVEGYVLTIYDLATETVVWDDLRDVFVQGGAVARLAKDLNERLAKEDARRANAQSVPPQISKPPIHPGSAECVRWQEARLSEAGGLATTTITQWVKGLVVGVYMPSTDMSAITIWLDTYCTINPSAFISDAAQALIDRYSTPASPR